MAHRFIAGETPKQAVPRLRDLAHDGIAYTVDLLGEATLSEAEADVYAQRYAELIEALSRARRRARSGGIWQGVPPVNISIKLSALCSQFEPAAPERVSEIVREPAAAAAAAGAGARRLHQRRHGAVPLQGPRPPLLRATCSASRSLPRLQRHRHRRAGLPQGRRGRHRAPAQRWREQRGAPFSVRLVKGAYWEEERIVASQNDWPVPVYEDKAATDASFERCTDALLAAWPHLRPAFGTHNPRSIAQALVKAQARWAWRRRHRVPDALRHGGGAARRRREGGLPHARLRAGRRRDPGHGLPRAAPAREHLEPVVVHARRRATRRRKSSWRRRCRCEGPDGRRTGG